MDEIDPYMMLYCDNIAGCRVNTFEYGTSGRCPACGWLGEELS